MGGSYEEYLAARDINREGFRTRNENVYKAYEVSVQAFDLLAAQLRDGRDESGKTHISLGPLFFIFQRQVMAAYESLGAGQAFLAWNHLRPGIEAALMMGKWVDDKRNADVWSDKEHRRKEYVALYQGKGLISDALPKSSDLQRALSRINDYFLHPNPSYYYRHLSLADLEDGSLEMKVDFFDSNDDLLVGIFGLLHLVVVAQDSIAKMFAKLFRVSRIDVGLGSFVDMTRDGATEVMTRSPLIKGQLMELGLWADLTVNAPLEKKR